MIFRGDIYMADLPCIQGESVQNGIRPVIIVQNNKGNTYSPTVQVIPLTSRKKKELPVHVKIKGYGLVKESIVLTEQITTIPKSALQRFLGRINDAEMEMINNCIAIQLGLIITDPTDNTNDLQPVEQEDYREYNDDRQIHDDIIPDYWYDMKAVEQLCEDLNRKIANASTLNLQEGAKNIRKNKVLEMIIEDDDITEKAIASKLDCSSKTIYRCIKELKADGIIERIGSARCGYWIILQNKMI